jgi:hypothetical protein
VQSVDQVEVNGVHGYEFDKQSINLRKKGLFAVKIAMLKLMMQSYR